MEFDAEIFSGGWLAGARVNPERIDAVSRQVWAARAGLAVPVPLCPGRWARGHGKVPPRPPHVPT